MDISEVGILLETPDFIKAGSLKLAAIDNEKNLIEVGGKIIRTKKASTGMHLSGIKFTGADERVTKFAATLIKEYSFREKNLFYTPSSGGFCKLILSAKNIPAKVQELTFYKWFAKIFRKWKP